MDKFGLLGEYLDDDDDYGDMFITQHIPEYVPDSFWEPNDTFIDDLLKEGQIDTNCSNGGVTSMVSVGHNEESLPSLEMSSTDITGTVKPVSDRRKVYQPIVEDISLDEEDYRYLLHLS